LAWFRIDYFFKGTAVAAHCPREFIFPVKTSVGAMGLLEYRQHRRDW
jgi:hypothetical protein